MKMNDTTSSRSSWFDDHVAGWVNTKRSITDCGIRPADVQRLKLFEVCEGFVVEDGSLFDALFLIQIDDLIFKLYIHLMIERCLTSTLLPQHERFGRRGGSFTFNGAFLDFGA